MVDEFYVFVIGCKIVKNIYFVGIINRFFFSNVMSEEFRDLLYSLDEFYGIVLVDVWIFYDIRFVIVCIVDGSEFDEFKKFYGFVSVFV